MCEINNLSYDKLVTELEQKHKTMTSEKDLELARLNDKVKQKDLELTRLREEDTQRTSMLQTALQSYMGKSPFKAAVGEFS